MTPAEILERLASRGQTLACAESLTGGLLVARIVEVPGASRVLRGGVVAYANDVKAAVLGVDDGLLAARGAVDAEVASQMAHGVCRVLAADWGLATTGVAGPDPSDGMPVGTVYVAVCGPGVAQVHGLALKGSRAEIRAGAAEAALELLSGLLAPMA